MPAVAHDLDHHRGDDRDHDGGEDGGDLGEQPDGDAGDRDVADAVAHEGLTALHEIGADGRGGQAGDDRGQQCALHELEGEDAHRWSSSAVVRARLTVTGRARPVEGGPDVGRVVRVRAMARRVVRVRVRHVVEGVQGRSVVGDPAVAHDDGPGDDRRQRPHLVGDQQDGRAACDETLDDAGEALLAGEVDPGGRLVEDQQVRLRGQRASDEDPLLLTPGEDGGAVLGPVGQVDGLERLLHRPAVGGAHRLPGTAVGQPAGGDHFSHAGRHAGRGGEALRDEPDPVVVGEAGERRAEELDRSGAQRGQAQQAAHQGRLPRAVGAEDRHDLSGMDGEVEVPQDRSAAQHHTAVRESHDGGAGGAGGAGGGGGAGRTDRAWERGGGHEQEFAVRRASRFCSMRET